MKTSNQRFRGLTILTGLLALTACSRAEYGFQGPRGQTEFSLLQTDNTPLVCDPFSTGNLVSPQYGIQADIYYLDPTQPHYSKVQDYLDHGHHVNAEVFLNDLLIPTRPFSAGFAVQGSTAATPKTSIQDENGNLLIEWFALNMKSSLVLRSQDKPGDYQLAVLSDDGFVMSTDPADPVQTKPEVLIDNDGFTATRMGCGTKPVHFDAATRYPVKMNYFQGPRLHIALVLMWRPWPANPADVNDPLCGASGNAEFFDSTQTPSKPMQPYQDLLGRGWKPLESGNFLLTQGSNRCSGKI